MRKKSKPALVRQVRVVVANDHPIVREGPADGVELELRALPVTLEPARSVRFRSPDVGVS